MVNHQRETIGPIRYELPSLDVGETWRLDLRNRERNGRKGWFRPYLPMDYVQVTNQSDQQLSVGVNNTYEDIVVANAVESYDEIGAEYLEVTNEGSATINANDITVVVEKTAYDADDRAREEKMKGNGRNIVERFTGIQL